MKKRAPPGARLAKSHTSKREIFRLLNRVIVESPIPLMIQDESNRILQISKGWTRFSGYTIEDIPTLRDWKRRAYGILDPARPQIAEFETDETVDDGEWVITAKDGSTRIWHFMVTPLGLLEGGRLVLVTAVDVTDLKRTEEALLKTEELLRQGVRVAGLGIFDHDQVHETVYWSPEMRAICGSDPDEPISLAKFIALVHPEDRDMIARGIQRAHDPKGGGLYEVEHRILRRDGSVRWVRIKSQTFFEGAAWTRHPVRTVGALLDITGQKAAEEYREQLLAREMELRSAAESANRLKDDFLSILSHELRTPLTSIIGWTTFLRQQQLDATALRAVDTINRNARTQQRLTEEILDVSRIASGKFTFEPCALELQPVIEAALESIRPVAEARKVRLETSLLSSGALVYGDPDRLLQMASNVLSNAFKFTPSGGTVQVKLSREGSSIRFIVSDTGEGIDPKFLPHVFDRFRQANSSSTRKHGGLGLGLAIVLHIVELHGGTIRAQSGGRGKGATFVINLPVHTPADKSVSAA
jgi:PAS domain S-box-containing protein